ncbi:MAG TPA: hypothetical protein VGC87_16510 [Pyrinomonadaceae bacterium]|jgi:hypothetical protein
MRLFEVHGAGAAREVEIILQTVDSIVPDGEGSYLAGPISTGRRFFQALAGHGAKDFAGLIAAIGEGEYLRTVRWPNVRDGEELAHRLRRAGVVYLINTGPIFIRDWRTEDYMGLCFSLIERKVRRVYFHPEWAYSCGAVEEFLFCLPRGLALLTSEGASLTVNCARAALEAVRRELQSLGLPTESVEGQAARLEEISGGAEISPPEPS